jgi:tetratricopeptide (TPR) repeat protein
MKRKNQCAAGWTRSSICPNSSFEFLSGWLSKKIDINEITKELSKINLEELRKVIDSNKELREEVDCLKKDVNNLKIVVDEIKVDVAQLKQNVLDIRTDIASLTTPPTKIEEQNLNLILKLNWVKRKPVFTNLTLQKIKKAEEYLEQGKSVIILGEGGIGKTTVLYQLCLDLLEKKKNLYTSEIAGLGPNDIYVLDNMAAKVYDVSNIATLPGPVLATSRTFDWINMQKRKWISEITITKEDHNWESLRQMLISMLKSQEIDFEEKAVEEAVKKSKNIPQYLDALISWIVATKQKTLSSELVRKAPEGMYELVADIISKIDDKMTTALLYSIAKTKEGRLHEIQLLCLKEMLPEFLNAEFPSEEFQNSSKINLQGLLDVSYSVYSLSHDCWKEVLTEEWKALETLNPEPPFLVSLRAHWLDKIIIDATTLSLDNLFKLKASDAAIATHIALENNPALANNILNKLLNSEQPEDLKSLVADSIALENTDAVRAILNGKATIQSRADLALHLSNGFNLAPTFQLILYSEAVDAYRNIMSKHKISGIFFSLKLAESLIGLGATLSTKGYFDRAIARLNEALNVYQNLRGKNSQVNLLIANVHNQIGNILFEKNDYNGAIANYTEAIRICQGLRAEGNDLRIILQTALQGLGHSLRSRGDLDGAKLHLQKAFNVFTNFSISSLHFQDADLLKFDQLSPSEFSMMLHYVGDILKEQDDVEGAIRCYERAVEICKAFSKRSKIPA